MPIACRTCGNQNPDGTTYCQYCGAGFQPAAGATPPYGYPPPGPAAGTGATPGPGGPAWPVVASPQPAYHRYNPAGRALQSARPALGEVKDPSTGLLLELIPGFFGFLGIGRIWAGDVSLGIGLLLGYWAVWTIAILLIVFSLGILAVCLGPLLFVLYFAAPIASGLILQKELRARQFRAPVAPPVSPF